MAYELLTWKAWAANATRDQVAEKLAMQQDEVVRLREAVKVLAENAHNINHLWELERNRQQGTGDWLMAEKHVDQSWREVMSNPIAAAAVREAGR